MRNCGVTKKLCWGRAAGTRFITPKIATTLTKNIGIIWHKRSMLVNDNTAECNISQEKKKLSTMPL